MVTPLDSGSAPRDGGTTCTIDGVYTVLLTGFTMQLVGQFNSAIGSWVLAATRADLVANPMIFGPYTFANGQVSVQDNGCAPGSTFTAVDQRSPRP